MSNPDQPRGPDGRWIRGGGPFLAALTLALTVGAGGLGASAGSLEFASGNSVGNEAGARGGNDDASTRGKARDRSTARATARLVRRGLRVKEREVRADTDCVAHSYGQVQDFFRTDPCTALFRALLEVRDGRSDVALVAVAWVDMPDADQAQQLQQLMDRPGTGNVTELSRENGGQRFSGIYYRSARDDNTVVNVQAEPIGRTRGALDLANMAADNTI